HFFVPQHQASRLHHVNPRVIEQVRIRQIQHTPVGIDLQGGHLLESKRKIQVVVWKVGPPFAHAPGAVRRSVAPDSREGKHVLLETCCIGPVGRLGAVPGDLPRRATRFIFGKPSFATAPTTPPTLREQNARQQREQQEQQPESSHGLFSGATAAALSFAGGDSPLISRSNRSASRKRGASSSACNACRFAAGSPALRSSLARRKWTSAGSGGSSSSSF